MLISTAITSDLDNFFEYLSIQLAGNGTETTALFQPVPHSENTVTEQIRTKFIDGFNIAFGNRDWRKLWLAKNASGEIVGHMDLRHHSHEHSYHRVLLGMGVDCSHRKQGVGEQLVNTALEFCFTHNHIDWLDLNVLSTNLPAKSLYQKLGFQILGEVPDLFRIDSISAGELTMTIATTK